MIDIIFFNPYILEPIRLRCGTLIDNMFFSPYILEPTRLRFET